MNNTEPQTVLVQEVMRDASMGTLGKEKKDFYDMVLKKNYKKDNVERTNPL